MIPMKEREAMRRAYYLEGKSKRQIANTTILAKPWIKRSTIDHHSPTG